MATLAISIVLYSPDIPLLHSVISSLSVACLRLAESSEWTCEIDLVNNNPACKAVGQIEELVYSLSSAKVKINYIDSGFNGGYGAGNNISIKRHSSSDFHLVLNPDVIVERDSLLRAVEYFDKNPSVGLITPKVIGFDNNVQHLCKQNPTLLDMFIRNASSPFLNRMFAERNRRYEMRDYDYEQEICPVPYPTGCFMLFRRSILDSISGFDEGFFLHYEDADIGRRVDQISNTSYVPSVVVMHKWSRDSHKSLKMRLITIKSGLRYWWKWGGLF